MVVNTFFYFCGVVGGLARFFAPKFNFQNGFFAFFDQFRDYWIMENDNSEALWQVLRIFIAFFAPKFDIQSNFFAFFDRIYDFLTVENIYL